MGRIHLSSGLAKAYTMKLGNKRKITIGLRIHKGDKKVEATDQINPPKSLLFEGRSSYRMNMYNSDAFSMPFAWIEEGS